MCLNPLDPEAHRLFTTNGSYQTLYSGGVGGQTAGALAAETGMKQQNYLMVELNEERKRR